MCALLPGRAMRALLLLRVLRRDASRRRLDLVGVGRAGVVAVQPAEGVVGAAEPVLREAPFERQLEGIELPLGLRRREVLGRRVRGWRDRVLPFTGIADHVDAVAVHQRTHVLDGAAQVVVHEVDAERRVATQLEVHAAVEAVLEHRLDVRVGVVDRRRRASRGSRLRPAPQILARHVAQVQAGDVERIERSVVDVPEVAAERAARDLVPRPVVVAAPAGERLHAPVAAHVVGRAEPRRDLVAEAELDRVLRDVGAERRDLLVLGADPEVQRQP